MKWIAAMMLLMLTACSDGGNYEKTLQAWCDNYPDCDCHVCEHEEVRYRY